MKKVFFLLVSLLFAVNALAQTTVKGVVVDSSNQPLIGAGVVQVGNTTNGTVSDIDGSFSLSVPATASLQVSCIGYTTKIVNIEGRTQLTIILDENSELLNDVVVVAFGQMKKEAFTGSAGTMKSEELAKVQVTNAASALAGRVAGLQDQQLFFFTVGFVTKHHDPWCQLHLLRHRASYRCRWYAVRPGTSALSTPMTSRR